MGIGTAISAGASSAFGIGQGIYSMIQSGKQRRQALQAIEDFKAQELHNAYKDVQVSTLGADLLADRADVATATSIDALQKGGTRALVGGVGQVVANNVDLARESASDLDRQRKAIDAQVASEEQNLQQMKEQRERDALAGLGVQLSDARQGLQDGAGSIINSAMLAGQSMLNYSAQRKNKELNKGLGINL